MKGGNGSVLTIIILKESLNRSNNKMNKPVKFAILGLGMIARHMGNAVSFVDEVIPYAVAARDEDRAKAFAEEFGFEKYYGSYEAMLKDPEIDAVYVAVPHALHCECALMCLEAGKNVIVEKPFAANAGQAERMFAKAREKGLFCAEGLWMRYVPVAQDIRRILADGVIGEVGALTGEIGYHLTQERLFDPDMAGGALLDVGVYACALADLVFQSRIIRFTADAHFTDRSVDETTGFVLRYEDGKVATMNASMKYMTNCRGTIWGTEGFIDIDDINCLISATVYDKNKQQIARYTNREVGNCYVFELESLVRSLNEGRLDTPECPAGETIRRMKNMDEIRKQIGLVYPFE